MAAQFRAAGLAPGTPTGYLQPVRFIDRRIDESRSALTLVRGAAEEKLVLGEDAAIAIRFTFPAAASMEAPLVFVGYGLHLPELSHDDFAGIDVRNKVVVYVREMPKGIPGPVISHARAQITQTLRDMGAAGAIDLWLLLHTLLGTGLVASGTNALNQYRERDADALMERTRDRPLPAGRLAPRHALVFASALCIVGLGYLLAFVSLATAAIVAACLVSYVFLYTPLKRRTSFNTMVGAMLLSGRFLGCSEFASLPMSP